MYQKGFISLLRSALKQVSAVGTVPPDVFPTLPLLEATEFGQQHLITTFYVGTPPPTLVVPEGIYAPALTLHILLPEGYTYWQPETGTARYVGGELHLENVSEPYQQVLQACMQQLIAQATPPYPHRLLDSYLNLLQQVAGEGWLLGQNANPRAEKVTALKLQQHLEQLCEPALAAYYTGRSSALYAWMARATYEESWVEQAVAAVRNSLSDRAASTRQFVQAAPVAALADGRLCVIIACCTTTGASNGNELIYPPHTACYLSFPDMEMRWRSLRGEEHFALFSLPRDEHGRPYLCSLEPEGSPSQSWRSPSISYQRSVSLLLERGWLLPHSPSQSEEQATARQLLSETEALLTSPLASFYQVEGRQHLGWLRRTLPEAAGNLAAKKRYGVPPGA